MMQFQLPALLISMLLANHCRNNGEAQDMAPPTFSESDTVYHGIFMPWDGIWEGTFEIYQDPDGQQLWQPSDLNMADTLRLKEYQRTDVIQVRQKYESITPYFQLVEITDTYREGTETIKTTSKGVNKVQDGQIWCIVDKPNDLVIHNGRKVSTKTLIWSRNERSPLRKEYFLETIFGSSYQIIGYGYYGDDDPDLSPNTWFLAHYHHVSDYFR